MPTASPIPTLSLRLLGCAAVLALAIPAGQAQSAQQLPQFNLQVQVPLVVEDVVVLDAGNNPVHNLKASDFTITDNGKSVTPNSFDEHATAGLSSAAESPAGPPVSTQDTQPTGVFTNRNSLPPGAALNILLLDALNTPMAAQVQVRRQMLKFLATLLPGEPIAIYGLSSHLYLLQGFTSDPALLRKVIVAAGSRRQPSPLLDNPVSGGQGAEADGLDALGSVLTTQAQTPGFMTQLLGMQMFIQGEIATYQNTERTQLTLEAFGRLARALSILPGRKNLIWFSGSFPIDITPTNLQAAASLVGQETSGSDANVTSGLFSNSSEAHFQGTLRLTDDLLRRSQIAIYPVDARGLFTDASVDASSNMHLGTTFNTQQVQALALNGGDTDALGVGNGSGSIAQSADSVSNFASQTTEEHATMNQMADETGGKAFYNNGDLAGAIRSAIVQGSNYYTVSYAPPSGTWDGKTHTIEISIHKPGLHLNYRRRYFSDSPAQDAHGQPLPLTSAMQAAMLHGAPDAAGLVFWVNAATADNATGELTAGSKPDPRLMRPPFRTCTLTARVDISSMTMTPDVSGAQDGTLEFGMIVYNANGDIVNQGARIGHLALTPDRYAQVAAHGLVIRQAIDVPAAGDYFVRVGVHDLLSDRVGTVEIPVAALASPQAVAQSTAPQ